MPASGILIVVCGLAASATLSWLMTIDTSSVVLGSRSPRRSELLGSLVGPDALRVIVPRDEQEHGFEGVDTLVEFGRRLLEIAGSKHFDVCEQLASAELTPVVVAADTVIIGFGADDQPTALEKPPAAEPDHTATVRRWFEEFYAERKHLAKTAVVVGIPGDVSRKVVVTTEVWFRADAADWVDWYVASGEPQGKAGGYAIQGAGSLFVERVVGSLSNVVGLPLAETADLLRQAGISLP